MSNMSYCRFQNTLNDLKDCERVIDSEGLSEDENDARGRLIYLCARILEGVGVSVEDGELKEAVDSLENAPACEACEEIKPLDDEGYCDECRIESEDATAK